MPAESSASKEIVTAALLVIGGKILSGRTKDQNISYLAEYLTAVGIDLKEVRVVGDDLRREPLDVRKATLASVLARAAPGLRLNEHIEADGPTVFAHACKMGLEGIVSKRKDSAYRSGRNTVILESDRRLIQKRDLASHTQ